jgi:hypothetical protein
MRWVAFVAAVALLSLTAVPSEAAVLYSTGFENPPFVLGPINGQAGWSVFSASGQTSNPVIENTLVKTGLQAVSVNGSVTGQTGPYLAPNFVDPVLDLSADIYLASSSTESVWQFGTTGAGGIGFAGGIDVASPSSIHAGGTSIYAITGNYTTIIGTFSRDTWHHVDLILDYATQTYAVELDGSLLAGGLAFCGNNFGTCNGAPVTSLGWALFDSFGGGNDLGAMDNFSISTPVPEPATMSLLGTSLLALGLVWRRRAGQK